MSKNINRGERMVRILLFLFQHPVRRYTTTHSKYSVRTMAKSM